jgi:hypothetical protein
LKFLHGGYFRMPSCLKKKLRWKEIHLHILMFIITNFTFHSNKDLWQNMLYTNSVKQHRSAFFLNQ